MSEDAVRAVLEGVVKNQFMGAYPDVAVEFENIDFKVPQGGDWISVRVMDADTHRANLGNAQEFKSCGVVNIQIQSPEKTGSKRAKVIRDALWALFADRQFAIPNGQVTCYSADKRSRGVINGWYSLALVVSYRYYHRRNG